jgi:hypothetical protein
MRQFAEAKQCHISTNPNSNLAENEKERMIINVLMLLKVLLMNNDRMNITSII